MWFFKRRKTDNVRLSQLELGGTYVVSFHLSSDPKVKGVKACFRKNCIKVPVVTLCKKKVVFAH